MDVQVSVKVNLNTVAGMNDDCRAGGLDDRRPLEVHVWLEQVTVVDVARVDTLEREVHVPPALKGGAQLASRGRYLCGLQFANLGMGNDVETYELERGDLVRLVTGTGGGWGNPRERAEEAILHDLRLGIMSKSVARSVYGLEGK